MSILNDTHHRETNKQAHKLKQIGLLTFMSNAILKSGKQIFGKRKPAIFNEIKYFEIELELTLFSVNAIKTLMGRMQSFLEGN